MDSVLRAFIIYIIVLIVFRISGKRTIAQVTTFDFVMLLIIGDSIQEALLGDDFSVTNAFIVVITLVTIDIILSFIKEKFKKVEKIIDGVPLILVIEGKPLKERLENTRVDEEDILEAARRWQGLERMEQIKYAILEKDGNISIVPKRET